jgi:Mn2+/Fe2+ NRAMP family transporter
VVTSFAGFIEVGSLSTSAQAGSVFGFQLLWAVALAALGVAVLAEMSGRLAAMSKHSVAASVREHFGVHFYAVPFLAEAVLDLLVLSAEIGGMAIAVRLLTGTGLRWWVIPAGLLVWGLLWRGTFGMIEDGVSLLGLVSLCFVVAVFRLHPHWGDVGRGFLPTLPTHHHARYAFYAVSILGATISPYLLNFYASGAVEEKWSEKDLNVNRVVAFFGMGFGSTISMSVLAAAALVLRPRGISVDSYEQAALMLVPPLGRWGVTLFAASLGIGCFGAALEIALNFAYTVAQASGWNWSEDLEPKDDARFSMVYTAVVVLAVLVVLSGVDPMRLTMLSMALTVIVLPIVVFPFLVLLNDERYVGRHTNHLLGNVAVAVIVIAGFLMAIVAVPLEILGG